MSDDLKWTTNTHVIPFTLISKAQLIWKTFFGSFIFLPVHPYFYPSTTVFTRPNDRWTGLCIKLWWNIYSDDHIYGTFTQMITSMEHLVRWSHLWNIYSDDHITFIYGTFTQMITSMEHLLRWSHLWNIYSDDHIYGTFTQMITSMEHLIKRVCSSAVATSQDYSKCCILYSLVVKHHLNFSGKWYLPLSGLCSGKESLVVITRYLLWWGTRANPGHVANNVQRLFVYKYPTLSKVCSQLPIHTADAALQECALRYVYAKF